MHSQPSLSSPIWSFFKSESVLILENSTNYVDCEMFITFAMHSPSDLKDVTKWLLKEHQGVPK